MNLPECRNRHQGYDVITHALIYDTILRQSRLDSKFASAVSVNMLYPTRLLCVASNFIAPATREQTGAQTRYLYDTKDLMHNV